jgi:hypothetical protein
MELHLKIIGSLLVILAVIHAGFPRYFKWNSELGTLSLVNRQMMMVHTLFIAIVILLNGLLCLSSSADLVNTGFGRKLSFGIGLFWTTRLIIQFFGYSPVLWRGKRFETMMHIIFTILWIYLSTVFLAIYFARN